MKVHSHSEKEEQALEYLRLVPFRIFMHSILESACCTTNSKGQRSHIWEVQRWKQIGQIGTQMVCLDGGGQVVSGQVDGSHLMKSWDTITTGRDTLPCAFCIIQTMGLWAQILGHHTNTSFCKTLFSYSLFTDHNYTYPHTSKSPKTWSESVSCWRDETAVSELLTLTDPLSKLSFAKLPKVYSPSDSISESKVVTAAKLMILVFEHKPGESIYSARHKSTEV